MLTNQLVQAIAEGKKLRMKSWGPNAYIKITGNITEHCFKGDAIINLAFIHADEWELCPGENLNEGESMKPSELKKDLPINLRTSLKVKEGLGKMGFSLQEFWDFAIDQVLSVPEVDLKPTGKTSIPKVERIKKE